MGSILGKLAVRAVSILGILQEPWGGLFSRRRLAGVKEKANENTHRESRLVLVSHLQTPACALGEHIATKEPYAKMVWLVLT